MTVMKLGWFALEVILVGFFLYFGSSIAFALAVGMALIPILLFGTNLYLRGKVVTAISAEPNVRKEASGQFTLVIENQGKLPVLRVYCKIKIENQLNRETQYFDIHTWLLPKGRQRKGDTRQVDLVSTYRAEGAKTAKVTEYSKLK